MNPRTLRLIALPVIGAALLAACRSVPSPVETVGENNITDAELALLLDTVHDSIRVVTGD